MDPSPVTYRSMKITEVEIVVIRDHWGPPEDGVIREWPLTLVHTDAELTGMGRGGDPELTIKEYAPLLIGEDPRRTSMLWHRMYEESWRFRGTQGPPPARVTPMPSMASIGAIDVALWDIYGKSCSEPVWRLLGGHRDEVTVYADGIGYRDMEPVAMAALAAKHASLGYDYVKIHLASTDRKAAVEKVRLSREAIGPEVHLMVDCHAMWDGDTAAEMARRFEPYDLFFLEEPVRYDDEPMHLRKVRDATTITIAGGEHETTVYDIRRLIQDGGLQLAQTDIIFGGGFTGLKKVAALAEVLGVPVAPHGAQYPDINCHLVAGVPNGLMVPACPAEEPAQIWSKLYDPPLKIVDGRIKMTDRPGLGLELDQEYVDAHKKN